MVLVAGDNTSKIVRGHWDHKSIFTRIIANKVSDFEINDVYMFFTQKVNVYFRFFFFVMYLFSVLKNINSFF